MVRRWDDPPAGPEAGFVYFDSSALLVRGWDGEQWIVVQDDDERLGAFARLEGEYRDEWIARITCEPTP